MPMYRSDWKKPSFLWIAINGIEYRGHPLRCSHGGRAGRDLVAPYLDLVVVFVVLRAHIRQIHHTR